MREEAPIRSIHAAPCLISGTMRREEEMCAFVRGNQRPERYSSSAIGQGGSELLQVNHMRAQMARMLLLGVMTVGGNNAVASPEASTTIAINAPTPKGWVESYPPSETATHVCDAVLQRLNSAPPHAGATCLFEAMDQAPTFVTPKPETVSVEEVERVFTQIEGFELAMDPLHTMRKRIGRLRYCINPKSDACLQAQDAIRSEGPFIREKAMRGTSGLKVQKFTPEIDVDNDGVPDPLIVVTRSYMPPLEIRPSIAVFVFDPIYKYLDTARTELLFQERLKVDDPRRALKSPSFRSIGPQIVFWEYQDIMYTLVCGYGDAIAPTARLAREDRLVALVLRLDDRAQSPLCEFNTIKE